MNWDENTPLSIANLNGLEIRISNATISVTNGKETIANAITAKGVPSTKDDTFEDMAGKIEQIGGGYTSGEITIAAGQTKVINLPWRYCVFAAMDDAITYPGSPQRLAVVKPNMWPYAEYNSYTPGYRKFHTPTSSNTSVTIESLEYTGTIYWEAWQK